MYVHVTGLRMMRQFCYLLRLYESCCLFQTMGIDNLARKIIWLETLLYQINVSFSNEFL